MSNALDQSIVIREATSDELILATSAVMRDLRPHIAAEAYLATVKRMMADGYRLAAVFDGNVVRAVAGYRFFEMLHVGGLLLYVDDLNTDPAHRSGGHGRRLIAWLKEQAAARGCTQIHLDSGVHRESAHRFYFRERFTINAHHFRAYIPER